MHRVLADVQPDGNLLLAVAFHQALENFAHASRELQHGKTGRPGQLRAEQARVLSHKK
jgi:hypothetical protein